MNLHKGVSRLWRLPTEVLSQIFHRCLPESNCPSELEAPGMSLTAVCRRWREVAVDTPSLWCRVSVGFDELPYRYLEDSQAFRYDVWLKRSQGRPLSLALICEADDSTMLQNLLQPYTIQILSPSHLRRCGRTRTVVRRSLSTSGANHTSPEATQG